MEHQIASSPMSFSSLPVIGKLYNPSLGERLRAIGARLQRGRHPSAPAAGVDGHQSTVDVDPSTYEVLIDSKRLRVSPKQFQFLQELARERGKVVHHNHLEQVLWGETSSDARQSLKQLVRRARLKIGGDTGTIISVPGVGYMLK